MADLEICQRNKFGNCKNNQKCKLKHEKEMCKSNTCKVSQYQKRHRKKCCWIRDLDQYKPVECAYKQIKKRTLKTPWMKYLRKLKY